MAPPCRELRLEYVPRTSCPPHPPPANPIPPPAVAWNVMMLGGARSGANGTSIGLLKANCGLANVTITNSTEVRPLHDARLAPGLLEPRCWAA